MKQFALVVVSLIMGLVFLSTPLFAQERWGNVDGKPSEAFRHVGTFDVMAGNGSAVAEIVDATRDGRQLVYTDSKNGAVGFVDISNPAKPLAQGTVTVGGEPTSLVILDPLVLVGVNTSPNYANPSGKLVVVDRTSHKIVAVHELAGQPDSLALAPDRLRAAIVIENERNEDLNKGLLPQLPGGRLLIVDLHGAARQWKIRTADLSPVAAEAFAGKDLEAEFVDINQENKAVVSFQENNHLAVVDLVSGKTVSHFPAGARTLNQVDPLENDLIEFNRTITKRAEPDGVAWIDRDSFVTANEGDYKNKSGQEGGSRSFTIFNQDGTIEFDSAASFEHWLASAGHYNEGRSENKGCEPEAVEVGEYGRDKKKRTLLFVGSERCNAVGVYDVSKGGAAPLQILPTGIGPEGLKAIPNRGLFVAAAETDVADSGIPTMITLYRLEHGPALYPMIDSAGDDGGAPIAWTALSGLAGDPNDSKKVYAVSDGFLAQGFIYTIDVSNRPGRIVQRLKVTGAGADLDLEAVAVGPDGRFWLGSEGNGGSRPNLVLKVDPGSGAVLNKIELPAGLVRKRRGNGIEGISVTGEAGSEVVYIVIQRAWPKAAGGDTDEVNTKIGRYKVATKEWTFVHYPLEPEGKGGWIGLSELTRLPNGIFAVIERDKGWGPATGVTAELKAIFGVDLARAEFRACDDPNGLVTIKKTLLRDLLPEMRAASIWTAEKLEGLAVAADGQLYSVTDNDGLDDALGETLFLSHGVWKKALGF